MKVQWVELSPQKRKALHIILKNQEDSIEATCKALSISRGSIFNKVNGTSKFKEKEYKEFLEIIGITDEVLEDFAQGSLIEFLLKKSSTCGSKA